MLGFFFWTFLVLFTVVSLFMVLLILIQKGRGGGLSGAFGGAGGNTAFGSKTGDVLTWVTSVAFGIFLLLAVILNLLSDARQNRANEELAANSPPAAVSPAGALPAGMSLPTTPAPAPAIPPTGIPSPIPSGVTMPTPNPVPSTSPAK